MELKEKLVSSFIAFENQISLDNTFVHNMRTAGTNKGSILTRKLKLPRVVSVQDNTFWS